MTTPTALAITLIREHADSSARASVVLIRSLRKSYDRVPDADLHESVKGTLLAVADYLEKKDDAVVIDLVEAIIASRKDGGLEALDFAVMSHCYMPPLRHHFAQHAPNLADALAAFDVVESIALPLMERLLSVAVKPVRGSPFLTALHVADIVLRSAET
jgi:hypothetical protein